MCKRRRQRHVEGPPCGVFKCAEGAHLFGSLPHVPGQRAVTEHCVTGLPVCDAGPWWGLWPGFSGDAGLGGPMGNRGLAPPWGTGMAGHPVSWGQRTSMVVTV